MKALYCYFGRFGDHNLDIPGHPLYQLFLLNSLAQKFNIDKFSVYYYDKPKSFTNEFSILRDYRKHLHSKLIEYDDISFADALTDKYDIVFLKYRFRNLSRLLAKSYDRLKFEKLFQTHGEKVYIIDTDAEVKERCPHVVSFFLKDWAYPSNDIIKLIPVLEEDIANVVDVQDKTYQLTFIGNEYFKVDIAQKFAELAARTNVDLVVQGKWKFHPFLKAILPRTERVAGYNNLKFSDCSVQISKKIYLDFDFMSPRIFESWLLGTLIFSQNSFMGAFSKFDGMIDLAEKIKLLKGFNINEYKFLLLNEISNAYAKMRAVC